MDWYYAQAGQALGPFADEDFERLVSEGRVAARTLVWRPGLSEWRRYGELAAEEGLSAPAGRPAAGAGAPAERASAASEPVAEGAAPAGAASPADLARTDAASRAADGATADAAAPAAAPADASYCSQCGRAFPPGEMIDYRGMYVCAACKPLFFQRIREGVSAGPAPVSGLRSYAGFWIRFAAVILDIIILCVVLAVIQFGLLGFMGMRTAALSGWLIVASLLQWGIIIGYDVLFIGKWGATPGKMACGLRVIVADGTKVGYARALGRWAAKLLSALTLLVGYIMAGFDPEKRALHDHICDTRVIAR